jgi:glycosyltransferase involved in cell wall biosynthesis
MKSGKICLSPQLKRGGGPASFQGRLAAGLAKRGLEVTYDLDERPLMAVLVIGGTRQLGQLWRIRRDGIPIVQRLNGMNWIHRRRRTGVKHWLRAEYGNLLLQIIRSRLAQHVIYQSHFSKGWWERVFGHISSQTSVVYNGVDLETYNPDGSHDRPTDRVRILVVEGNLGGGYEWGLTAAVNLAEGTAAALTQHVELLVVGGADDTLQSKWMERSKVPLRFTGWVERDRIPQIDRSAHVLYAADVNAACPNSVIEAMACGLPVVSFDTGALPEMVTKEAGRIALYGGDPWKLATPDVPALIKANLEVLQDQESFRAGARRRAEAVFGLDTMVDGYLDAMELK